RKRLSSGGDNLYPHWTPRGQVTWTPPHARVAEAAYSRTGARAELRDEGGPFVLYAGDRLLARGVDSFTWSPDGKSLAYVHARNLYAIRADGTDRRQLTHGPGASLSPQWSSDGKWVAFERLRGQHSDVFVVRADGS